MEPISDFLYATPSFWEGMARILDLGNTLNEYNRSPSSEMADEVALRMDWAMVGNSLRNAMRGHVKEIEEESTLAHK